MRSSSWFDAGLVELEKVQLHHFGSRTFSLLIVAGLDNFKGGHDMPCSLDPDELSRYDLSVKRRGELVFPKQLVHQLEVF